MQFKFGGIHKAILGATLGLMSLTADAAYQIVNVAGTAGPWDWELGGLNGDYAYGLGADGSDAIPDYTPPARLKLADIGIGAGDSIYITYLDGLTNAFGDVPNVNNNGHVGSVFKDDELGSSGQVLPSYYYESEWGKNQDPDDPAPYGLFLQSLVGALTDDGGNIVQLLSVGSVIKLDSGQGFVYGISFELPVGATYVQFGLNDDIFGDNTGSLNVCVSSVDEECGTSPVPVPGAVWMFGSAIAGLATYLRRRV
ncbi:hypothetical protein HC024_06325 [Methylococcaceae bacterium WWC4]|nr:hypothetical protein [Methylococcaceae bacterium WWC4]